MKLSKPRARQAYRDAQNITGNDKWSENRRPPKNILQAPQNGPNWKRRPWFKPLILQENLFSRFAVILHFYFEARQSGFLIPPSQ